MEEGVKEKRGGTIVLEPLPGQTCTTWMPEEQAGWYVTWRRKFVKSRQGPLSQRSGLRVDFLEGIILPFS